MNDFSAHYREMTVEQLMQVAHEGELQPMAAEALATEMAARRITEPQRKEYAQYVAQQRLQLQYQEKSLSATRGVKIAFRGPRFLSVEDRSNGIECRTRWLSILWIPLIPLGSFRVHANPPRVVPRYEILSKVELNWAEVLRVWSIEASAVLLLITGLFLLDRVLP